MRNKKGQALVEMALILPILLILVFGVVDFGRAMYAKNSLNNAARSGARAAAVTPTLTATPPASLFSLDSTKDPVKTIQSSLYDGFPRDDSIIYELKVLTPGSPGSPVAGTATSGNQVEVILTWPNFPMITPLHSILALITNSAPDPNGLTISVTSSMRYE